LIVIPKQPFTQQISLDLFSESENDSRYLWLNSTK